MNLNSREHESNLYLNVDVSLVNRQKQNTRDETIGYLGSLLKRAEADNESQIYRAQAEKAAKTYREEQEKYEKQQQMLDSIEKHRLQSVGRLFYCLKK